jgi:glycosyltransferase involved in cell wall biosynthesis
MMRVALVNNFYYVRGGSERVLLGDQQTLTAAGCDVRPFSSKCKDNLSSVSAAFFPEVASYEGGTLRAHLSAAIHIVYSYSARQKFSAFLDDFRPNIIHCHNIYGRLTTSILDEARHRRIPTVMTVHDMKLVCPSYLGLRKGEPCHLCADGRFWRCLRWKCHKQSRAASLVYAVESYFNRLTKKYNSVSMFLCPSRFIRDLLLKSGVSPERAIYHPNALPSEEYITNFNPGEYALFVGRLSAEKGILTLLEATHRAGIPLRIAGIGPLEGQLRTLVMEKKMSVAFEGHCTGNRLAELYRSAAFTVTPSEWYENASMSILESFAYGKPVLASRIGGNPELVADLLTGRLFKPGCIDELTVLLREMWANKDELRRMGIVARKTVTCYFDQHRRVSDLLALYAAVQPSDS